MDSLGLFGQVITVLSAPSSHVPMLNVLKVYNAQRESHCCTSSHGQSNSDNLPDDHETSSEWRFKGHMYFASGRWPLQWPEGKLMKTQFRQLWRSSTNDLRTVPVPVHRLESFYNSAAEANRELLKLQLFQGYHVQANHDSGENGEMQLRWSGQRSRADFRYMKCSDKSPCSKCFGFQSNAAREFSNCQMFGRTCGTI